jgi:hypothetical protein
MKRLMRGRTAFMIAHRESTLDICDVRLQIEHGRVVAVAVRSPRGARVRHVRRGIDGPANGGGRPQRRPKHVPVPCDPATHPAVSAWHTIAPNAQRVEWLDRLRSKEKLEIYRLGLADGGGSVIAKRRRALDMRLERTIYECVLPRLPHPTLAYFGSVTDENPEFEWLFIEDGGDERCSLARHGRLAARWLGTLHGASAGLEVLPSLPARDTDHYLGHLRAGRGSIVENFDNRSLGADDKRLLAAVISHCDRIESSWNRVEALCSGLPRTFLHGDLEARNIRIRHDETGLAVVAFDWEWSGFGVPAVDVSQLAVHGSMQDLAEYRATISEHGPAVEADALAALVLVGIGFRLLASLDWIGPHLAYPLPDRATATLRCYEPPLREWAKRLAAVA